MVLGSSSLGGPAMAVPEWGCRSIFPALPRRSALPVGLELPMRGDLARLWLVDDSFARENTS